MNYDQFWNRENKEEAKPVEEINWEDEFDADDMDDSADSDMNIEDSDEIRESDDFLNDSFTEEEQNEPEEDMDDSEMYSVSSLFDIDEEEVVEQPSEESIIEPEPVVAEEPVAEPVIEPEPVAVEPVSEPEPVAEPLIETESVVKLPSLMEKVFTFIPPYCNFGTYIRSISESDVNDIVNFIEKTKEAWLTDGKDKMFNIPQTDITIAVLNDKDDPLTNNQRIQSLGVQMFAAEKEKWNCLKLFFELDGTLKRAEIEELNRDSFEDWQWKIVQTAGFELWKSRQTN